MKFTSAFFASVAVLMTMPSSLAFDVSVIVPSTTTCDGAEITTDNISSYCQATGTTGDAANCEGEDCEDENCQGDECENGSGKSGDEDDEDEDDSSSYSCVAGDTIKVSAYVEIENDFDTENAPDVYVTPCISVSVGSGYFTLYCYSNYTTKVANFCDTYNYNKEGASCGAEGQFYMEFDVTMQEIETPFNMGLTYKTTLSGCEDDYSYDGITYGAVGVVLLGVAAGLFQNRRRCVACLSEESGDDTKSEAFIEMNDIEDPGAV